MSVGTVPPVFPLPLYVTEYVFSTFHTAQAYTISYENMTGITNPNSATYTYGVGLTLSNPTQTGYAFGGWYDNISLGGTAVTSLTTTDSGNKTFYAKWTQTYSVTYHGNGSTGGTVPTDANEYVAGTTVTPLGNPNNLTKTNYEFMGWSLTSTGTAINSCTINSSNITLYAIWAVIPSHPSAPTAPIVPTPPTTGGGTHTNTDDDGPALDDTGETGSAITNQLEDAETGEPVVIDMNGTTKVLGSWLETIAGRDVDMVLDMGNGITWTINGNDITGTDFSNIDLAVLTGTNNIPVDILNNITGENSVMQITFSHDGSLGFTATLSIDLGKKNKGMVANLFYYNEETGALEFQCSGEIDKKGNADLKFKHFSSYAIVIDSVSLEPENIAAGAGASANDALISSDSDNNKNIFIAFSVLISLSAVIFVGKVKKRKITK